MNFIVPLKKAAKLQSFFDNDFYPIFICGVAGSGNTLLSSLLDQRYLTAGYLNESALTAPAGSVLCMESVASCGPGVCETPLPGQNFYWFFETWSVSGLQPHVTPKKYRDRPNQPGKGLRNVVNGEVKVAPQASSSVELCLSASECEMVQQRLFSIYERLIQYADNK